MLSRKKRDAKFLIFQSLYIIAIAILFYKGTDLSLNKVTELNKNDTVIAKTNLPGINQEVYDPSKQLVLPVLQGDTEYVEITKDEIVISKEELDKKNNEIARLEKIKTPNRITSQPKEEKKYIKPKVKGLRER